MKTRFSTIAFFSIVSLAISVQAETRQPGDVCLSVPRMDPLALAIAKVTVNESRWRSKEDMHLIWQVTQNHGQSNEEMLSWLRRHSSCVLTDREMSSQEREGNCVWTRHLKDDDTEPAGWDEAAPWSRYVRPWRGVRRYASLLVQGRRYRRPCAGRPMTWGSRRLDLAKALSGGLRPLGCASINEGFEYP